MKAEFELTVDGKTGEPIIRIIHHDRIKDLEQTLLGVFVDRVKANGMILRNAGGLLECGIGNSEEYYEIRACAKNHKPSISVEQTNALLTGLDDIARNYDQAYGLPLSDPEELPKMQSVVKIWLDFL